MAGLKILNKANCIFYCPVLLGIIEPFQIGSHFKDGNAEVLTQSAALNGLGICMTLTAASLGIPQLCTLRLAANWTNGIETTKTSNSIPMLNQLAEMPCPVGSLIKTIAFPDTSIAVSTLFSQAENLKKAAEKLLEAAEKLPAEQAEKFKQLSDTFKEKAALIKQDATEYPKKNQFLVPEEKTFFEQPAEKIAAPEKTPVPHVQKLEPEISSAKSLCAYGTCENLSECPYLKTPDTIPTQGAAAKLRKNSPVKEQSYDSRCEPLMEKYQTSWGNQAHHIISIKAAYCQYRELVKLGNYFGYDINCQENCAFLPSWERGDGYGEKNTHYKKAQAYEVMRISGLQWHVGQHDYAVQIPEAILQKYPKLRGMDCYNTRINKEVQAVLRRCQQKFRGKCLEKHYASYRTWFLAQMNGLSRTIEEHLDIFGMYPKDSFPYYVSLESLKFAYEIPQSRKVVVIHQTASSWVLKKYHYTNYISQSYFQLLLMETKMLADTQNHRDETIRKLILFCENVSCFIVIDETQSFRLPFHFRAAVCYLQKEDTDKIHNHISALFAEQAENGSQDYISPKAMIHQRLKECQLL